MRHISTQHRSDFTRQGDQAFDALSLSAKFVVINDAIQFFKATGERSFLVCFKEKFRVRQARANYAFIATNDVGRIGKLHVGHNQEAIGQLAVVEQGKIFLIRLHGQNQAFLWNGKEACIKLCGIHRRMLNQGGDFIDQGFVVDELHVETGRCFGELSSYHRAPGCKISDDFSTLRQHIGVLLSVRNFDFATTHKAMPTRELTAFQSQDFARHDIRAVQQNQSMYRTHKLCIAIAPAHEFGDG